MASIGRNLSKKGVIMTLLSLVLMNIGCEEQIEMTKVPSNEGKMVDVSLNIGFADEVDGATLSASPATKSNGVDDRQAAFDMQLLPAAQTKAASNHPDKLYNLDIHQYTMDGSHLKSFTVGASVDPGAAITSTLDYYNGNECQLLIIARGATPAVVSLSDKALSAVRGITADTAIIKNISAIDGNNINNMPYLLYLPKVKISLDGKLVSPEGTDVRLLLKRLAVGLTINWNFNVSGYALTEVRLMQVPKDYRILPEPESLPPYGTIYPNSVSEFIDGFRLKGEELANTTGTTLWMPANARGIRSDVTSQIYRNKDFAHSAATYVEFVVDGKGQRLLYRAYLGANNTTDFNLLENTNYNWTINLNNANYAGDPRIQLLDLTPVTCTNVKTTSNCFMMEPGTNICFNPYKHEAGTDGWNTRLIANNAIISDKTITSVKVLWQTKDAGTTGNLVMGYVIDGDHHENLVNLTDREDMEKARIHIKVPNTLGGNAVIAAYNDKTVVWSWHLWISDYVPVGLSGNITSDATRKQAIEAAQNATRGGMVHVYGGISWTASDGAFYKKVIMDRNLGATKAGIQTNLLDGVRTFGLLYQGGRKDPFFSSADGTQNETKTIYDGDGKEVEIEKKKNENENGVTDYDNTIKNPKTFYLASSGNEEYKVFNQQRDAWGPTGGKTIYDPCPKGWRVPSNTGGGKSDPKQCMMAGFGSTNLSWVPESKTPESCSTLKYYDGKTLKDFGSTNVAASDFVGSGFIYTAVSGDEMKLDKISDKSAFFPGVSLREMNSGFYRDKVGNVPNKNNTVYLWTSSVDVDPSDNSKYNNSHHIYQFQSR